MGTRWYDEIIEQTQTSGSLQHPDKPDPPNSIPKFHFVELEERNMKQPWFIQDDIQVKVTRALIN